ncbi:MAG: class I SAM-dependent methyltransferase [bacterium]
MPQTDAARTEALRKYFANDLGWGWARNYQAHLIFKFLMEVSRFCDKGVLLDAGAGHQRYRPFFSNCLYISQEHHQGIAFKGMEEITYDLLSPIDQQIPLKDNSVDGILSTSVVEHLQRPADFIVEAFRVLKPGGKLFINVPFVNVEHEIPYDYNRPTRYVLDLWLKEAGFKTYDISPSSSCTEAASSMLSLAVICDMLEIDEISKRQLALLFTEANSVLKKIGLVWKLVRLGLVYGLTRFLCSIIKLVVDRGPYQKAGFPVGWVVVATKPGKLLREKKPLDRETFLKRYQVPAAGSAKKA